MPFIVLEGISGSGTTTICRELVNWDFLKQLGGTIVSTCEPTYGVVGNIIRDVLRGRNDTLFGNMDAETKQATLGLLFAADRLDHCSKVIGPALNRGELVISDRYLLSSVVYQGAQVRELNREAIVPDLTILLDVDPSIAISRIQRRGKMLSHFENLEDLIKKRSRYLRLATGIDPNTVIINSDGTIQQTLNAVKFNIKAHFGQKSES